MIRKVILKLYGRLWTKDICFFDYKNIDWNEVHQRYRSRIAQNMTDEELFGVLADMLEELQDGHVNLSSSFDMARYWKWFEDYPV